MTKSGQRSSAFIEDLTASVTWMKGETTLLSAVNVLVTRYGQASVTMMNLLEMLLYPTISQSQKRTAIATIFGRGEVMTGENECLFMSYQNSYANHNVLSAGQENTFKSRDFTYPLDSSLYICYNDASYHKSQISNRECIIYICVKSFKIDVLISSYYYLVSQIHIERTVARFRWWDKKEFKSMLRKHSYDY